MKDLTQEERQELIEWCEWRISHGSKNTLSVQPLNAAIIALAALTAEPVYWEIAGCLFSTEDEALKPGFIGTPEPLYESPSVGIIPEGWKLVPVEPTPEMVDAHMDGVLSGGFQRGYRALLAAAPTP